MPPAIWNTWHETIIIIRSFALFCCSNVRTLRWFSYRIAYGAACLASSTVPASSPFVSSCIILAHSHSHSLCYDYIKCGLNNATNTGVILLCTTLLYTLSKLITFYIIKTLKIHIALAHYVISRKWICIKYMLSYLTIR